MATCPSTASDDSVDESIARLPAKSIRALGVVDEMSPELRELVHQYGYELVDMFLLNGVNRPKTINMLIQNVWIGARSKHQKQGNKEVAGLPRRTISPVAAHLDWLLIQAEANITAAKLIHFLDFHHMLIVPKEPSTLMIEASMATVTNHDVSVTKIEKHRRRLRAALIAAAARLWPQASEEQSAQQSIDDGDA